MEDRFVCPVRLDDFDEDESASRSSFCLYYRDFCATRIMTGGSMAEIGNVVLSEKERVQ